MAIIKNPITVVESGGDAPVEPLNPQVVYQQTRPADWMEMPTPANNEIYLLVEVAKPLQEKDPGTPIGFQVHTSSTNYQVELGTVESGQFVADSTYTTTLASSAKYTNYAYYADWATHPMTNGNHQVVVKITPTSGNLTQFNHLISVSGEEYGNAHTLEIRGHCEGLTRCIIGSNSTNTSCALKYFSLEGTNSITTYFNSMFNGCHALTAVLQLGASHGTDFGRMFQACQSLVAIPQLDTGSGTNFENMFYGCTDLVTIPLLDTSSGTNFGAMFSTCYSLKSIPLLDTSHGTNFSNMFYSCYVLTGVPLLDTSSGTNFSNMFNSCVSLTSIPPLDTSSGTTFGNMFNGCQSLIYIDFVGYDFTAVTVATSFISSIYINGGTIMRIDDKFQMSGSGINRQVVTAPQGATAANPAFVVIEDENAMIPLGANATTVFTNAAYFYVIVPDSMYSTYSADAYWSSLGARLKKRSDVTLPTWYTS